MIGWNVALLGTGWMMLHITFVFLWGGAHAISDSWTALYNGLFIATMLIWTGFIVWLAWKLARWAWRGGGIAS